MSANHCKSYSERLRTFQGEFVGDIAAALHDHITAYVSAMCANYPRWRETAFVRSWDYGAVRCVDGVFEARVWAIDCSELPGGIDPVFNVRVFFPCMTLPTFEITVSTSNLPFHTARYEGTSNAIAGFIAACAVESLRELVQSNGGAL